MVPNVGLVFQDNEKWYTVYSYTNCPKNFLTRNSEVGISNPGFSFTFREIDEAVGSGHDPTAGVKSSAKVELTNGAGSVFLMTR